MGLECIGAVDAAAAAQVVSLALRSLALTERDFVLEISHMGFVTGLFDAVGAAGGGAAQAAHLHPGQERPRAAAGPPRRRACPARGRTPCAAWGP